MRLERIGPVRSGDVAFTGTGTFWQGEMTSSLQIGEFKYRAFISYSHKDEAWARWLHHALESYRIPRKLVGKEFGHGPIPRRLQPVFRDRDELGSSADLSRQVREALADSEALIVICSPAAAASRWVNQEIKAYRALGREARIFAVIVDGEPGGDGERACFPPALIEGGDGSLTEPLAADARKWADGRSLARLKLLSGILGIPLDGLRRRDLQRRQRSWVMTTIGLVVLALIVALAVTSRMAAEKRRALAEELVGFKLNDLEGRLELPEGFDILARLDEWPEAERAEARERPRDAAMAEAMELRSDGLARRRSGDTEGARGKFRQSWLLLAVQHQKYPEDRKLLFELGQAEFWIGLVFADEREFEQSARSMAIYADISRRLLRAAPERSESVLEMAYALSNLGYVEMNREGARPDRALQYMQSALEFNQIALVLDPDNALYRVELEQSHANIADAQLQVCDLGGALHARMESTRLAREFHENAPQDEKKKRLLAYALGGLAGVQRDIGLVDQSLANLEESINLLNELYGEHPESNQYRFLRLNNRSRLAGLLYDMGRGDEARIRLPGLQADWEQYIATEPGGEIRARINYAEFLLIRERIEVAAGEQAAAEAALQDATDILLQALDESPGLAIAKTQLALAVYDRWKLNGDLPDNQVAGQLPAVRDFEMHQRSCQDINMAARLAAVRGDQAALESYTSYLLSKGYFEPGFIRFCRSRGVCAQ